MAADPSWKRRVLEAPRVERVEALGEYGDHAQDPGHRPGDRAVGGRRRAPQAAARRVRDPRHRDPAAAARRPRPRPERDPFAPGGAGARRPTQDDLAGRNGLTAGAPDRSPADRRPRRARRMARPSDVACGGTRERRAPGPSRAEIENLLAETRTFPPDPAFAAQANATADLYDEAERDYEAFWASARPRERLDWSTPFETTLEWDLPFAKWFVGGELNVAYNCVDRHVERGLGDKVAYHWIGEPGDTRTLTYADLHARGQQGGQRAPGARASRPATGSRSTCR